MSEILLRVYSEQGLSPWLDNLQRSYITSGKLKQIIANGVRGVTSNPTIFQRAIQGSNDYDEQFLALTKAGVSSLDAYWALVVEDIKGALKIFSDLYESSGHTDGFVSVEVDPRLARDTAATLKAARELNQRVGLPNVMIKIPATEEGLPAIQQMIADGCNVNVTLIFSLERYQQVIDAYIAGLEERVAKGLDISNIQSVASFFISRVDNDVDALLDVHGSAAALDHRGKVAIAQARLAYSLFQNSFSGSRWESLAAHGASVQRPLWASTSTKNPSYPDTLYVDQLIGPHSVNTLPEPTLEAFSNHGVVARTIDSEIESAQKLWETLPAFGVDMNAIAEKLENEGVSSFISSFVDLIEALDDKAASIG